MTLKPLFNIGRKRKTIDLFSKSNTRRQCYSASPTGPIGGRLHLSTNKTSICWEWLWITSTDVPVNDFECILWRNFKDFSNLHRPSVMLHWLVLSGRSCADEESQTGRKSHPVAQCRPCSSLDHNPGKHGTIAVTLWLLVLEGVRAGWNHWVVCQKQSDAD